MSDQTQKRRNPRFPVERDLTAAAEGQQISGKTRDVNAEGLFFFTTVPISEGSRVSVLLKLPAGSIFSDEVVLRASGKAVRIERSDGDSKIGVAVSFEQIQIDHSTATSVR